MQQNYVTIEKLICSFTKIHIRNLNVFRNVIILFVKDSGSSHRFGNPGQFTFLSQKNIVVIEQEQKKPSNHESVHLFGSSVKCWPSCLPGHRLKTALMKVVSGTTIINLNFSWLLSRLIHHMFKKVTNTPITSATD